MLDVSKQRVSKSLVIVRYNEPLNTCNSCG